MKTQILSKFLACILVMSFIFSGCKQKSNIVTDSDDFSVSSSESKVLRGYGINTYEYRTTTPDLLAVNFVSNGLVNRMTYAVNAQSRTHVYELNNGKTSFKITYSEPERTFTFSSSLGDNIEVILTRHDCINKATGTKLSATWFKNLKFNYQLIFQAMEVISETQVKKQYVNSIALLDKKVNDAILVKKALAMKGRLNTSTYQPCSSGNNTCAGQGAYNTTQTVACAESHNSLGANCSNQYCIGYCKDLGCDCVCVVGTYFCSCTAKGYYCTGAAE